MDTGLPGVQRIGVPGTSEPHWALAGTLGYGFTEAQPGEDGPHHRVPGHLGVGFLPNRWLGLSLRLDGRYDRHPDDGMGTDDGWVFDQRIAARAGGAVSNSFLLGGELAVRFPGADDVSTSLSSPAVDAALLGTLAPAGTQWFLASMAGFRFDRSGEAGDTAGELRLGDRLALGLNDSHAVLLGLGFGTRVGKTELLGEASYDLLLGSDAPSAGESPLRVGAGVRQHLSRRLALSFWAEFSPSSRPPVSPSEPLVAIEPRVSAFAGLRYQFSSEAPDPAPRVEPPKPKPPPAPVVPKTSRVTVVVSDPDGNAVQNVGISLEVEGKDYSLSTEPDGRFRAEEVAPGRGTVRVEAEGFEPLERSVVVSKGEPVTLEIELSPLAPPAQLRGLVRSFGGVGLKANIVVEPLGTSLTTDDQGFFTVDVPPGSYEVLITAEGYQEQRRKVEVEEEGVTILNADLRKATR